MIKNKQTLYVKEVKNLKETQGLIQSFYNEYLIKEKGAVILLEGNLGSGKTAITKIIGKLMGIQEEINSPSFVIYNQYVNQNLALLHYDLYRLDPKELEEMELRELWYDLYLHYFTIHCIEWWEKAVFIESSLPLFLIQILVDFTLNDSREIHIYKINQTRYESLT